jgi:hypothetical protein
MTAGEALRTAMAAQTAKLGAWNGDVEELSAELERSLAEIGFKVAKDYHSEVSRSDHRPTCNHCGRPENTEPFVIPGTPLELLSSERDAGRWRHWGGDDVWTCRSHPGYLDGDRAEDRSWERRMELYEAVEHLAARDGLSEPLHTPQAVIWRLIDQFEAEQADWLAALDAQAPDGGHHGAAGVAGPEDE